MQIFININYITTNEIVCIYSNKNDWRETLAKTIPKGSLLNVSEKCISSM